MKLFSDRRRPVHWGPFPAERLRRTDDADLLAVPPMRPIPFRRPEDRRSIVNAMAEYQAMLDAIRDGLVNKVRAACPDDPLERTEHLKAFGYFSDAALVGACALTPDCHLAESLRNGEIDRLAEALRTRQTRTLAAGIDLIMADLRESMSAPARSIAGHGHALVFLYEYPRDPAPDEPGTEWIKDAQAQRACLRATETACVIANYLRLLGFEARAHSGTSSDVDLNVLAVRAGLATAEGGALHNPFLGARFGLAAVTTDFELAPDRPLAPGQRAGGMRWRLGFDGSRRAGTAIPFARRRFKDGAHPFERLRRRDTPTTFIDEPRIPRVPKRTDMFARAQFGDMGKTVQAGARAGHYVRKAAPSAAQRRALGAFVLLQDGAPADGVAGGADDARRNADNVKAACYFLGIDAVGISRCPDWAWYSHDAAGAPIAPPHDQAISVIIDQGFETMEGASGDDWISVAQSMRAYLRFSLLGGVIAQHIRNLGFPAKAHSVMDGDVLQPPLLLLSGLGEVSRIGEVILNPFLGPRLKSGVVTTTMPMTHDRPIDFGLQRFCEGCNKCARECPSGAITAGPKLMFNGYEIWKSDSQKCATYRITTPGGAMCGRCMKTCPWNLEGLFAEAPFRWAAMNLPGAAPALARLDDAAGRGGINPVKKWWWDLELAEDGGYGAAASPVNRRTLHRALDLRYEDQTLAVYPAPLAPHPFPYPDPMDREGGIAAHRAMIGAAEYRRRLAAGETGLTPGVRDYGPSPVLRVEVAEREATGADVVEYALAPIGGGPLPPWEAGAHVDVVVAPEYLRQYSLCGDPADRSRWRIAVLREAAGDGGSVLLQRIFQPGRRVFVSYPINHFPLVEDAPGSVLIGGGIGVTPLVAMAHRLHALGRDFTLHYAIRSRAGAGLLAQLEAAPWRGRVVLHVSDEGGRADCSSLLGPYRPGWQAYTCGPERLMTGLREAAAASGWPEEAVRSEYFAAPPEPPAARHAFTLRLARSGRDVAVGADEAATDALLAAGVPVDVKCSDGICGVCRCRLLDGAVEHRDHVLSRAQRADTIILCRSRAAEPGGIVTIDR